MRSHGTRPSKSDVSATWGIGAVHASCGSARQMPIRLVATATRQAGTALAEVFATTPRAYANASQDFLVMVVRRERSYSSYVLFDNLPIQSSVCQFWFILLKVNYKIFDVVVNEGALI